MGGEELSLGWGARERSQSLPEQGESYERRPCPGQFSVLRSQSLPRLLLSAYAQGKF